ncbi:MAG: hypothetical protein ACRCVT_08525 [Leadbetterella sp.]
MALKNSGVFRPVALRSWGFGKPELSVNHEPQKYKTKFKLMTKTPIS